MRGIFSWGGDKINWCWAVWRLSAAFFSSLRRLHLRCGRLFLLVSWNLWIRLGCIFAIMGQKRQRGSKGADLQAKKRKKDVAAAEESEDPLVTVNDLNWKEVALPDRLEDAGGFFGLEEIDGVEVIKGGSEGLQFKVCGVNWWCSERVLMGHPGRTWQTEEIDPEEEGARGGRTEVRRRRVVRFQRQRSDREEGHCTEGKPERRAGSRQTHGRGEEEGQEGQAGRAEESQERSKAEDYIKPGGQEHQGWTFVFCTPR